MRGPRWHVKITRDATLFVIGTLGLVHETLLQHGPERPTLILVFAACIGLPLVLRGDEKR